MQIEKVESDLGAALSRHLEAALQSVKSPEKIILALDLDDTTWTVKDAENCTFGSTYWLADIVERYAGRFEQLGIEKDPQSSLLKVVDAIFEQVNIKPCDEQIPEVVTAWQAKGTKVVAATARMNTLSPGTKKQLDTVDGLRFTDLNPDVKKVQERMDKLWQPWWNDWPGLHHNDGIWHLSMANKGMFLKALAQDFSDHAVIFADDSFSHIQTAHQALSAEVPHSSFIHYTGSADHCRTHHCPIKSDASMARIIATMYEARNPQLLKLIRDGEPFLKVWVADNVAVHPALEPIHAAMS
ncbi:hypothetical protein DIPPA_03082 [Diplonema papillatum]|nr:hypothetical protein DIPPA_03082 [Diplonema papillatum]